MIRIGFLFGISFSYGLECPENEHFSDSQSKLLNFQNEFDEILSAFEQNDVQKLEEMLTFFKNKGSEQFSGQDDGYTNDSLRFVV